MARSEPTEPHQDVDYKHQSGIASSVPAPSVLWTFSIWLPCVAVRVRTQATV